VILDTELEADFSTGFNTFDDIEFDFHPGFAAPSEDDVGLAHFLRDPYTAYWNLGDFLEIGVEASRIAEEVLVESRLVFNGYILEAAIPWKTIGVAPDPGGALGIAASISDNDDPETNVQQCMISSAPDRDFRYPQSWGTLFLMEAP
jgi:hypothetical protein